MNQRLFDFFAEEHGLILTEGQANDIINECNLATESNAEDGRTKKVNFVMNTANASIITKTEHAKVVEVNSGMVDILAVARTNNKPSRYQEYCEALTDSFMNSRLRKIEQKERK